MVFAYWSPAVRTALLVAALALPMTWYSLASEWTEGNSPADHAVTAGEGTGATAMPEVPADWWGTVQRDLAEQEYEVTTFHAGLQAPNRAHNFRSHFRAQEVEIVPRQRTSEESWRFAWQTTRFGRPGDMMTVPAMSIPPQSDGARVVYERPGFREWYENTKEGLEQGFTIERRPPGSGPLTLEGTVAGGLLPQMLADESSIDLVDDRGETVLRYGELHVWDAEGRELEAELSTDEDQRLAILIDDEGARYPLTVDPILTSPAWIGQPNQDSTQYGVSVATAGDVNGDGFSDVIVGAPGFDNGETDEGRAFVYLGSSIGLSITPAWSAEANQMSARFGGSVASAGDVNGDGFADVIVGAFSFDNGQFDEGRAYVFHGAAGGLSTMPVWIAESNQVEASFGISVGMAGDVNGDGFADVIIAATLFDNGQPDEGRAYVYHGSAAGLAAVAAWTVESDRASSAFGKSVGTAGDVNGDGFADVIVGAPFFGSIGRASVYHGSATGLATTAAWFTESGQVISQYGYSVATAGDVNGDGYADVIVGSPEFDNGDEGEGKMFAYHGSATGLSTTPAWTIESNQFNARFGFAVAPAGDVNGDGFADVVGGAPFANQFGITGGFAQLFIGSPTGLVPDSAVQAAQQFARFGIAVGTAGDVNGDGYSDVIVGADFYDNGQQDEGGAFVYHGSGNGLATSSAWHVESDLGNAQLGRVAGAGDVNGDGYSDVIVGAHLYDNGEDDEGRAFVYHGSSTGLSTTPAWIVEGNLASAQFGYAVANAGDVNGDGFSDVIVGARMFPDENFLGVPGDGKAFVYHGSPTGLATSPAWTAVSQQIGTEFAFSVASAGDVNGDGFGDVVVGAMAFDNGEANEGQAYVYKGSPSGLQAMPAWTAESNNSESLFGRLVASAGDVNQDGYSDVFIGAPFFHNVETAEGKGFVYHGSAAGLSTTAAWTVESNVTSAGFAFAAASAGDVNADGFSDVVVGAPFFNNGQASEGRAFLYLGGSTGLSTTHAWSAESNQVNAVFGASVSLAGDVNGDGNSDVIIGAYLFDNDQTDEGRVFVYHGSQQLGLQAAPAWFVESNQAMASMGFVVDGAGDVNGDGFSDVIVGSPAYDNVEVDEGRVNLYYGNQGDGLERIPRQARHDDSGPIDLLGRSSSLSSFRVKALGRTAAGRGRVRLEVEVKPLGVPFNGTGLTTGSLFNTGTPNAAGSTVSLSVLASGLAPETPYHWRLRITSNSPLFPGKRWFSMPMNAITETDLRTRGTIGIADEQATPPAPGAWLGAAAPNPFASMTDLAYSLPAAGQVRIAVYDVTGRAVAVLADELRSAGNYRVRWDGRDARGMTSPAGVYIMRLQFAGQAQSRKMVLAP